MKNMKFKIFLLAALTLIGGYACDSDKLTSLDDPKYMLTPENSDMSMMFTNLLINYGRNGVGGNALRIEGNFVKYYSTYSNIALYGNLYMFDQGLNDSPWNNIYTGGLKMSVALEDYLVKLNNPNQVNNLAMTRIMKVANIQRLTDFYGDVPVTEACKAYTSNILKPKYDTQQDIYKYMLETLDDACTSLSTDATIASYTWKGGADAKKARDIVYNGDVTKWKKYGYSLMLRIAMRASDADPAMAKLYAEKAIAGGVITDNADNWTLKTLDGMNSEKSPYSSYFEGSPSGDPERYMKLGEYFVDFLSNNLDPRRKVIFGGRLNSDITAITASDMQTYWRNPAKWNWDLTQSKGMIHGTNANPVATIALYHQTYTSPNPFLFQMNMPIHMLTASEMQLLISEASLKGWSTGTSADAAYTAGVRASIKYFDSFSGLLPAQRIDDAEITAYLNSHPLGTGAAAKQRIAEEMWVSLYLNPIESWSNVRRMNLVLPDNSVTAHMPVKYAYVENDRANNLNNLTEALTRIGLSSTDTREVEIATRCWWDVN
jgi:hypothetical protein